MLPCLASPRNYEQDDDVITVTTGSSIGDVAFTISNEVATTSPLAATSASETAPDATFTSHPKHPKQITPWEAANRIEDELANVQQALAFLASATTAPSMISSVDLSSSSSSPHRTPTPLGCKVTPSLF
ncbi:hypothetical protein AaE_005077 [Aphanomyces astaci]|uniref:Uncharacterized protein n=1 Tax=Aphanomyces astaci TaxID=112090 RepID=A0A6A5AQ12_APHAT|nr:hypothetical protein AaE_005077 [Aphanomyces astaci]